MSSILNQMRNSWEFQISINSIDIEENFSNISQSSTPSHQLNPCDKNFLISHLSPIEWVITIKCDSVLLQETEKWG